MKKFTAASIVALLCVYGQLATAADSKSHPAFPSAQNTPAREAAHADAQKALAELKAGNVRYASGKTLHPHTQEAVRKATAAHGQRPFAIVLSCSDSRVPVEILFDQGVGDIFPIRNAGNVIDDDVTGSAEYAVEHLGTPLLVVMGHTKCGAVTAAATNAIAEGKIAAIIGKIKPAVERVKARSPQLKGEEAIQASIMENTMQSANEMLAESIILREAIAAGKLKITGALYDIESGKVEFFDIPRQPEQSKPQESARG